MEKYPRLCYFGPAIDSSVGGSALLYKLLRSYPRDCLISVEMQLIETPNPAPSIASRTIRIPRPLSCFGPRGQTLFEMTLLYGRHLWAAWLDWRLRDRQLDAVVCVTHTWLCEPALLFAKRRKIPFHAIVHDHVQNSLPVPRRLEQYRQRRWERICREAETRLCVSPYMAEDIQQTIGLTCAILYPGLAPGMDLKNWQPVASIGNNGNLAFIFIGTVHGGYQELIIKLWQILKPSGHRLILHSPSAAELVQNPAANGVEDGGWIATHAVANTLRQEADILFLPMSFEEAGAANMKVSFPSKLVEYCAAGRPILIWGPPYCSAVRWAKEHPGFAEVVDTDSSEAVADAVRRLEAAPVRERMGRQALKTAADYFSHEKTFGEFIKILSSKSSNG